MKQRQLHFQQAFFPAQEGCHLGLQMCPIYPVDDTIVVKTDQVIAHA